MKVSAYLAASTSLRSESSGRTGVAAKRLRLSRGDSVEADMDTADNALLRNGREAKEGRVGGEGNEARIGGEAVRGVATGVFCDAGGAISCMKACCVKRELGLEGVLAVDISAVGVGGRIGVGDVGEEF